MAKSPTSFVKGQPRIPGSGRAKGTPNKKTQVLVEILEAKDFNVPAKLIELVNGGLLLPKEQADVLLELMQYVYPKRKAVEMTGADGEPLQVVAPRTTEELIAISRAVREGK